MPILYKKIFRSVPESFVLVQHTFTSTKKPRSVSFARWVFLKLSAGQLEASGNLLLTPQKSEGEFLISRPGNEDFPVGKVPGTNF